MTGDAPCGRRFHLTVLLLALGTGLYAQIIAIHVTETAGIRRTGFPVNARVPVSGSMRLMLNGKEVPVQISPGEVDFNAAIGPGETQTYLLEPGLPAQLPKGLVVTEDADAIQVGSVRFSKTASPLLLSVKYRGEDIGHGANGIAVTDESGNRHDLVASKVEILKRGPLYVAIRYTGTVASLPFVIDIEMPNSKTMIKVSASIQDPEKRLREISLATPLAFAPLPWFWDFGTNRWTYGQLHAPGDSVALTTTATEWSVVTGNQLYEKSAGEPVRWGHFQDGKEVVAFALENIWKVTLDGAGQALFRSTTPAHMAVIEHFVNAPVQIGAATSPSSLLSPLRYSTEMMPR